MKNKRKKITIITLLLIVVLVIGFIIVNKLEKQESVVAGKLQTANSSTTDTYTIYFDANGGTGAPSTMTITGTSGTLPATEPTRSGYEFMGWTVKSDPTKVWCIAGGNFSFSSLEDGDLVGNTLTLTALWEEIYTIKFDANGGTGAPSTMTIRGTSGTLPTTEPTRSGYEFMGWTVNSDPTKVWCIAGGKFSFNSLESGDLVGNTLTLKALWVKLYTIKFDANGGTGAPSTITLRGTSGTLPSTEPTKTDYEFLGWSVNSDPNKVWCIAGGKFSFDSLENGDLVNDTLTLTALWRGKYTIKFDANGGTGLPSTIYGATRSGTIPDTIPTRLGYEFRFYSVSSDPDRQWTIPGGSYDMNNLPNNKVDLLDDTLTLIAQWYKICTIKFDANGGFTSTETMEIREGLSYTDLPSATRTGYTFQGWYDSQTGGTKITEETIVNATDDNSTLYAHWTPNIYTITFNSNGGTGTMSDIEVEYSDTVKLSSNEFTRTDYSFTGWNTKADGTGISYKDEDSLEFIGEDCNNITLYAQWQLVNNTYVIEHYKEIDGNYLLADTETKKGKIGEQVTAIINTYDGYIFDAEKSNSTLSGTLGDTTLTLKVYYKKLEGNFIKIFLKDSNSGEIQSSVKVTLYDDKGNILKEMVSNSIGEVAFDNLEKGQKYAYKIENEEEINKFIVTESGSIEDITDEDESGDSDNSGSAGDKDESGDSDNSGNTGDKDESGDSDNSGSTGDKDESGDSDNSGNAGDKNELGDSDNYGNAGDKNESESSKNSNNTVNTEKIPTHVDNTTSQDTLPKTGINKYIIFVCIILVISITSYIKYKNLKNI